ncbi:putative methyltransferase C9orf114 homolog [Dioscorea cayenensis subsp. rotundata]|uniref:Methyltransferase C9orf114 homolog n=1 Tax=Dioscorea cayennensis subsp. rotundata TaxID=55577 RepID=A0AB40D0Y2_DIOCR|nr:putative methyltransferase C9orf114 homolog [Dioscorea cayenensis subsp. rotundata]
MNGRANESKHHKKKKKRKRRDEAEQEKPKETPPTVSIAVSGSIIDNAQSLDLATLLAGQIARAVTIFRIDEVVVFDSKATSSDVSVETRMNDDEENERGAPFLVRILRYLETPQYLRKHLFPIHKNLKCVGLLPPLDAPHHLRKHEWSSFREGVTLERSPSNTTGTLVDVGLSKSVAVEQELEPGIRVTVAMGTNRSLGTDCMREVVSSMSPREEGLYWGYKVRYASNISSVFKNCPFKGGYDHIIGTSEHGLKIKSSELIIPAYRHLLIAFGGLGGLEESIEEDGEMKGKHVNDVFSSYLNTCPLQGSRTIRTEEAVFISLQYFQEAINKAGEKI